MRDRPSGAAFAVAVLLGAAARAARGKGLREGLRALLKSPQPSGPKTFP